ncbi:hypothetical protein GTP46_09530 [Duganella sp. FT135W]|uniref:5'-nucleotidase n=1 Tax=Duganella flavida TaxID=2692175 RepID=A0A6L8K5U3_9BURK|nr:5'-nucleotidase [Duganella flavida]MYM22883.1 hypothetical protein [Duganella flavida]
MPYSLQDKLVVGVASSALFDLSESDKVFRSHGEAAYRKYQEDKLNEPLPVGISYSFIKRLLTIHPEGKDSADAVTDLPSKYRRRISHDSAGSKL